jgi:hypothetical protein
VKNAHTDWEIKDIVYEAGLVLEELRKEAQAEIQDTIVQEMSALALEELRNEGQVAMTAQ